MMIGTDHYWPEIPLVMALDGAELVVALDPVLLHQVQKPRRHIQGLFLKVLRPPFILGQHPEAVTGL